MKKLLPLLFFIIFFAGNAFAQPASIDLTFNPTDKGFASGDGFNSSVNTSAIQTDGKIIVGGYFSNFNGVWISKICRLDSSGSMDFSFNHGSGVNDNVFSITIQSDDKIVVGGAFTDFNGTARSKIVRLNTNGSLDATFNPGSGFNSTVFSTSMQSDGRIIAGGFFTSYNSILINKIARLNIDGSLDSTFNPGTGFNNTVRTTNVQSDGKIIVGGSFNNFNGIAINCIARLNADGSMDSTFNHGSGFNATVHTTAIQADGKIIIGGDFTSFNGTARNYIARLNTDGSLDTFFNSGSVITTNGVYTLAIQNDGKIIVGGIRLNSDGSLDSTFNTGIGYNNPPSSITLQSNNKIVAGGGFTLFNGKNIIRITRLNGDGSLDTTFNPKTGFDHRVHSITVQNDDKILVGGDFADFNGTPIRNITRLNSNGSLDLSFNNPLVAYNSSISVVSIANNGKIIIGGIFPSINGIALKNIARLNSNGSLDVSFNPGAGFSHGVNSVAVQSDGKIIVGGAFTSFNGTSKNYIARLNSDGSLDASFNAWFNNSVSEISIQTDGKIIVVGYFTGNSRNGVTRLNPDGTIDFSFNPGGGVDVGSVKSLAVQNNGKIIIAGYFSSFSGTAISNIARLNVDGTLDTSFNHGLGANILYPSVKIQSDGKIIVGGDFSINSGLIKNIARLNTDGSLDSTFNSVSGFNQTANSVAVQKDGKIIVGGDFVSYDGIGRNRILRLEGDCTPGYYNHYAKGNLFGDVNNDCEIQSSEAGFSFPIVTVPYHSYAYSDSTGKYSLGVSDSVNYSIKPIIPLRFLNFVSNPCPANYAVLLDASHPQDTIGFDFGFDYNPCHQLRVDVGSSRRRRCFLNTTSVYYTNEGIIPANGVEVIVKMPEYVIPLSASHPYTWNTIDSTMVFNIGTLNDNQSGTITIIDSVACINGLTGLTQCTKAWITPPNICIMNDTVGSSWDKSSILVEGNCVNDTVVFVIYNTGDPGTGDMTGTSEYRIYANNAHMQSVPFQLTGGDSLVVTVVSGGATIRLEADQHSGHPGNSQPRETVEACGTSTTGSFNIGMVTLAPQNDEDLHVEIDCMPITDSYDPNDKNVNPAGIGPDKIVLPETLLDYTIRFQNTGTDTAYKVVVVDTLSPYLDISTLELGTSSFPYSFKMSGAGSPVLSFTFDGINLTDTFTNELGSHGFVKFKIAPFDTVPLGSYIENFVDIFFDYNLPIRTNTAAIKIDSLSYTAADLAEVVTHPILSSYYCEGDSISIEAVFTGNNLTYQWYKDSLEINGATTDKLLLNPITVSDTGIYYCSATGHLNSSSTVSVLMDVREVSSTNLNETACKSYNLNGQNYTTTGIYSQTLTNVSGCDSTITLNLIINTVDTSVDQNNIMLTATITGAFYQWLDCNNNFSVIVGEISQSYTASTDGSYAVMVTQNNCSDTSFCYSVTGTSIEENTSGNKLVIYPNPTSGNITISSGLPLKNANLKVLSLTGQIIFEDQNLNGNLFHYDLNKKAKGIFLMEINDGIEIRRIKLILN